MLPSFSCCVLSVARGVLSLEGLVNSSIRRAFTIWFIFGNSSIRVVLPTMQTFSGSTRGVPVSICMRVQAAFRAYLFCKQLLFK